MTPADVPTPDAIRDVLSGHDLAREWAERIGFKYPPIQGQDGIAIGASWVWCATYMDFDYIQAWLLEVSQDGPEVVVHGEPHASQVADHLAVIWEAGKFDVCWRNVPHERWPGNAESHAVGREAWTWFAGWIEAEMEARYIA